MNQNTFFTRGQFWPLGIVVACISCVHVCVCVWMNPCNNLWLVQATMNEFGPEVQNTLVKIPIVLAFFSLIDLDLEGQI